MLTLSWIVKVHPSTPIENILNLVEKYLRGILSPDRANWLLISNPYCTSINNVNFSAAGDLVTFSKLKVHYKTDYQLETNLFTKETRTKPIKSLYENAKDLNETQVGVQAKAPTNSIKISAISLLWQSKNDVTFLSYFIVISSTNTNSPQIANR